MNFLINLGNRFAADSDWKDFALTKFCLCAMGVVIGALVPEKGKKPAILASCLVFWSTYLVLMAKVVRIGKEMLSE